MKLSNKTRLQLTIQKIIFLSLLISIVGMLAWLSNHYDYQFDLTANKRHSLSENSVELLNALDKEITVHAYSTDTVTKKAIREIIARYQRIKNDFTVKMLNPDIDIEQARKDGIVMNKAFAFVIYYNNQMEHIESLSEQAISNALLRLNRRNNQQIVFLTGHGERAINNNDNQSYSTLNDQLNSMGINLNTINLLEEALPDNTKLLVIAAPAHQYLAGEIEKINQFINNGGNLLWLTDPGKPAGLEKLATSFGLQLQEGLIIDNNPELRKTLNIEHPAFIPVTEYYPHSITNTLRYNTLFPMVKGISPLSHDATVNNWQAAALFSSSAKSWSESGGLKEEMTFKSEEGDVPGPIAIAVALTRTVNQDSQNSSLTSLDNTEQRKSQRVVVIGDSDFLSNTYIGASANLNLGLNIFNWLIGDDDFISVEPQASPDTKLVLNDTQLMIIAFGFFLVIPLLLLFVGFRIWYKRKNR